MNRVFFTSAFVIGVGFATAQSVNIQPAEGNAQAQADSYPKMIAFLKRTLDVKP